MLRNSFEIIRTLRNCMYNLGFLLRYLRIVKNIIRILLDSLKYFHRASNITDAIQLKEI